MNLDDQLRSALRREEPPEGFAGRVLAGVRTRQRREPLKAPTGSWLRLPRLYWAAACALLVVLAGAGAFQYQQRRRGEIARQQVMLALEIASVKLSYAQGKALDFSRTQIDLRAGAAAGLEKR